MPSTVLSATTASAATAASSTTSSFTASLEPSSLLSVNTQLLIAAAAPASRSTPTPIATPENLRANPDSPSVRAAATPSSAVQLASPKAAHSPMHVDAASGSAAAVPSMGGEEIALTRVLSILARKGPASGPTDATLHWKFARDGVYSTMSTASLFSATTDATWQSGTGEAAVGGSG